MSRRSTLTSCAAFIVMVKVIRLVFVRDRGGRTQPACLNVGCALRWWSSTSGWEIHRRVGEPWPSLLRAGGGTSWSSEFGGAAQRWRKVVPTTTSRQKMAVGSTVPCSETLPAPHCVDSVPETDAGIRPTVSSRATVSSCSSRAADHPSDGLLLDSHPVVGEQRSRCCCKSRSCVPGSTLPQQGGGTQEFEFLHSYATRHIDSYQPRGLDWDPMLVESSLPSPGWALSDVAMQSPLDTAV
jgi:hypothetical protein